MYGNTRWGSWLLLLERFIELRPVRMSQIHFDLSTYYILGDYAFYPTRRP